MAFCFFSSRYSISDYTVAKLFDIFFVSSELSCPSDSELPSSSSSSASLTPTKAPPLPGLLCMDLIEAPNRIEPVNDGDFRMLALGLFRMVSTRLPMSTSDLLGVPFEPDGELAYYLRVCYFLIVSCHRYYNCCFFSSFL